MSLATFKRDSPFTKARLQQGFFSTGAGLVNGSLRAEILWFRGPPLRASCKRGSDYHSAPLRRGFSSSRLDGNGWSGTVTGPWDGALAGACGTVHNGSETAEFAGRDTTGPFAAWGAGEACCAEGSVPLASMRVTTATQSAIP
jgi:hypothetical protein